MAKRSIVSVELSNGLTTTEIGPFVSNDGKRINRAAIFREATGQPFDAVTLLYTDGTTHKATLEETHTPDGGHIGINLAGQEEEDE